MATSTTNSLHDGRYAAEQAERELLSASLRAAHVWFEEALELALGIAEHAYTRAQALDDDVLCARALTLQGSIAVHRGQLRDATEMVNRAELHALETDNLHALAEIAILRAQICFFTGVYSQALGYADHALALSERDGDPVLRIHAQRYASMVFGNIRVRGRHRRLDALLDLTQEVGDLREEAYTRNNIACELLEGGEIPDARREIRHAFEIAQKVKGRNSFLFAVLHSTRADIELEAGNATSALADTQHLRALLASLYDTNPYVLAAGARTEVQAYAALGRLDDAQLAGEQALALLGDRMPHSRGQILATLATALRAGGRMEVAYDTLARSAELERRAFWEISELQLDLRNASRRARTARRERDELAAKNRELSEAHAELERRAAQLEALQHQLREQADRDWLTGLRNRRYLARQLKYGSDNRMEPPCSVAVLDLDHFKQINDSLGHAVGDRVLVHVAALLGRATRETDVVVRSGGEEFLIVMPQTDERAAVVCGERVRAAIEAAEWTEVALGTVITASVGVASTRELSDLEPLVLLADQHLYEAKRAGRNRVIA